MDSRLASFLIQLSAVISRLTPDRYNRRKNRRASFFIQGIMWNEWQELGAFRNYACHLCAQFLTLQRINNTWSPSLYTISFSFPLASRTTNVCTNHRLCVKRAYQGIENSGNPWLVLEKCRAAGIDDVGRPAEQEGEKDDQEGRGNLALAHEIVPLGEGLKVALERLQWPAEYAEDGAVAPADHGEGHHIVGDGGEDGVRDFPSVLPVWHLWAALDGKN